MPKSQNPEEGDKMIVEAISKMGPVKVLDVGAGEGKWGNELSDTEASIDACEIWAPNCEILSKTNYYDNIINADVSTLGVDKLKEYDTVILGDVFEHIHYDTAVKFINELKDAGCKVFLTLPISTCIQGPVAGNPYETHVYQWTPEEVEELGFEEIHRGTNPNGLVWIGTYTMNV